MKWALLVVAVPAAIAALVWLVGLALPRAHTASRVADIAAPPDRVWKAIQDVGAYPSWRADVRSVELLAPVEGRPAWREVSRDGGVSYEVVESVPDTRFVSRITDRSLPYGGEWVMELAPSPLGTRLAITERGEIYNPVFRVAARFVIGYTATIDRYLHALQRHVGAAPAAPPRR